MSPALYLDLSALQSVPAANLNRDDLGSPKQVLYGGASRIRVSSQAWKRPIRQGVEQDLGERATRTRTIPQKVAERLEEQGWEEDLARFAGQQVMRSAGGKKGISLEKAGHTSVLLFVPEVAVDELATICEKQRDDLEAGLGKKSPGALLPTGEIVNVLKSRTASISLLGRMLAEVPGSNVDGAAQVAHAFTTHGAEPQRDYFTAVDDWTGESGTGSGHLDTAEFSSGVFYRYATVNISDLVNNLEGDREAARTILVSFAEHFLMSLPQAKKTSTAPHTLPDLAYLAVRRGRPLSLAAAFEAPVPSDGTGYAKPSRAALATYADNINRLTGSRHRLFHGHATVAPDEKLKGLGDAHQSFDELIDAALTVAMSVSGEQK